MDRTTLTMDRKQIRNLMAIILAGIIIAAAIGCVIYYLSSGFLFTNDNKRTFEVLTYLALALMIFVIGLVITYVVGVRTNYTDAFRVRRSYAYQIRKQSIMIYSPIAAILVCIVKAGSGYVMLSQRKPELVSYILFWIVVYLLYTMLIAAAVTFLLSLSKVAYIGVLILQPWIFTYFASINKIPVYLGVWNIGKTAILCGVVALLWILLLIRLKRVCYRINTY
ncbi:MAG: hypothetical protein Q4F05_16425 [bacterium]|nr:hypothetical protein [bacterium]